MDEMANEIDNAFRDALRKEQPALYSVLVTLVAAGQTKKQIMRQVNYKLYSNGTRTGTNLVRGLVAITLDVLIEEQRRFS